MKPPPERGREFHVKRFYVKQPSHHGLSPEQIADRAMAMVSTALTDQPPSESIHPEFAARAALFAHLLALWGRTTNLIAEPDNPAAIAFHILDSLAPVTLSPADRRHELKPMFEAGQKAIDIGSGAGFPGLNLALATRANFTLVEARRRRASFLTVAAAELGLENVEILNLRLSPSLKPRSRFDLALSRASGPLADFYPLAAALLKSGGTALLFLNPSQRIDMTTAHAQGFSEPRRYPYSVTRNGKSIARALIAWRFD